MIIFISFFFFLRTESLGWKTSEEKKQRTNPGIQGGVSLLPRLAGEERWCGQGAGKLSQHSAPEATGGASPAFSPLPPCFPV